MENKKIEHLNGCCNNFPFIEKDFDSMTMYNLYCKLDEKINDVIKDINTEIDSGNLDGTTFIPKISNITGGHRLSWSNNGELENPETIDILNGDQIEKENTYTVKSSEIPEIVDAETFRTYFYKLRKNDSRKYQFELNPDNNQNIINALGGYPPGENINNKAFIYVEIPYSEAGGFVIKCMYVARNRKALFYKYLYATLDSAWNETEWISYDEINRPKHNTMIVTAMTEGFGFKSDYTANEIKRHADGGGVVILRFNAPDGTGEQSYNYETYTNNYAIFRRTILDNNNNLVTRISIKIDNNYNVVKDVEELQVATSQDLANANDEINYLTEEVSRHDQDINLTKTDITQIKASLTDIINRLEILERR